MGWIIAIGMFAVGCFTGKETVFVASGLFAIAGSISFAASTIKNSLTKKD